MTDAMAYISTLGPFALGDHLGGNGQVFTRAGVHKADGVEVVVSMIGTVDVAPDVRRGVLAGVERLSMKSLQHILSPYQWGEESGFLWCAWRRLPGDHAGRLMRTSGIPPLYVSLELGRQITLGLQDLESVGRSHGALSPASVFIDSEARIRLLHVVWSDILLGIEGRYLHPAWMSVLPFTAPEVAAGGAPSPAGDAYSLGAFLHFLILGRPTHWADDPRALLEALRTQPVDLQPLARQAPPSVLELIEELLALDPEDRPVNWPALIQRFAVCAEEAEAMADEESPSAPPAAGPSADDFGGAVAPPPPASGARAAIPPDAADTHYGSKAAPRREEPELGDPRFAGRTDLHPYGSSPEKRVSAQDEPISETDLPGPASAYRERLAPPPSGSPSDQGPATGCAPPSVQQPAPRAQLSARDDFGVSGYSLDGGLAGKSDSKGHGAPSSGGVITSDFGESSSGVSTTTLGLILAAVVIVLLGGGFVAFMLLQNSDARGARSHAASSGVAARKPKITDAEYTATANTVLAMGRFVQIYKKAYNRFPETFKDMGKVGENPLDAWGTALDLRQGFVVSAGRDRQWDTGDDLFFDPDTSLIGGFVEGVDLPDEVLALPSSSGGQPEASAREK